MVNFQFFINKRATEWVYLPITLLISKNWTFTISTKVHFMALMLSRKFIVRVYDTLHF